MLWNDFFLFSSSFLWLVPSGYEARFFYLNSLYIFFMGRNDLYLLCSIVFLVLSTLSDDTYRCGEKVLFDHWLQPPTVLGFG